MSNSSWWILSTDPRVRRICELEYEITIANIRGHKATQGDEYHEKREELANIRKELSTKTDCS
jgi:hypothetical protein